MPDITVTDEQLSFLETLREDLAEQAGPYAHVRQEDALQYLIDAHRGDLEADPLDEHSAAAEPEQSAAPTASTEADEESESESESSSESDGGSGRLDAMMKLLDTHDDKWGESEAEDARYVVTLPDGSEEHVQTKDNVRALLFKNYER